MEELEMIDDVRSTIPNVYFAPSREMKDGYSLMEISVVAGGGPPPDFHQNEDEAFLVIEGHFRIWVEGSEPVDLIRVKGEKPDPKTRQHAVGPRYVRHYFKNVGDQTGRLLLIFTPGGCENYFKELDETRRHAGDDLLEREEAINRKYGMVINRRN